jgi:hypothetical protein
MELSPRGAHLEGIVASVLRATMTRSYRLALVLKKRSCYK